MRYVFGVNFGPIIEMSLQSLTKYWVKRLELACTEM